MIVDMLLNRIRVKRQKIIRMTESVFEKMYNLIINRCKEKDKRSFWHLFKIYKDKFKPKSSNMSGGEWYKYNSIVKDSVEI